MPASSNNIHMVHPFGNEFTPFPDGGIGALRRKTHIWVNFCRWIALTALATGCSIQGPPPAPAPAAPNPKPPAAAAWDIEETSFSALPGWLSDDLREAWPAWLADCQALQSKTGWKEVCALAGGIEGGPHPDAQAIRHYFEAYFVPYHVGNILGEDHGLITGYYEPVLRGSREARAPFLTPLYGVPDDLITIDLADVYPELKGLRLRGRLEGNRLVAYPSRAELAQAAAPHGKELVWVDDPIAAFFFEVQGSGRIQLYDRGKPGKVIRLGYADQNGRPYKSIGRWLADQGEMPLDQVSMQSIEGWAKAHPEKVQDLLDVNPSYVFFKELPLGDPRLGPRGALGVPLTPGRSIAVDARIVPLGAAVFLDTTQPLSDVPLQRLTFAQDTGGAIQASASAPVRADLFWGFGEAAGAQAGRMKQTGRMWLLLPRGVAPPFATAPPAAS